MIFPDSERTLTLDPKIKDQGGFEHKAHCYVTWHYFLHIQYCRRNLQYVGK